LTKGLVIVLDDVVLVALSWALVVLREKRAAARVREEAAAGRDAVTVLASNATRSTRKGKDRRVVLLRLGVVWGEEDAAPAAASAVVG
jgi:hypothetical protein